MAMTVTVNGKETSVPEGATVSALLAELGLGRAACAVEVNKRLVTKREHGASVLKDGDRVEIVTLVGGG